MSNKMPTNLWAYETNCKNSKGFGHWYDEDVSGEGAENKCTEYTLVHNNPDYHVIKKGDVDVQNIIDSIDVTDNPTTTKKGQDYRELRDDLIIDWFERYKDKIRNALIAQSVPDMVTIPRKVLEGGIRPFSRIMDDYTQGQDYGYNQAIDEVLNYKPTMIVGEERSDEEGE